MKSLFENGRALFVSRHGVVFLLVILVGSLFALYTNHAWEDWYITYRASKNLAMGYGLVFNPGEHVHTFTSPLNVLLPALFSYLTGNSSDELVLWLYRAVSLLCLGCAGIFFSKALDGYRLGKSCLWFALVLFMIDVKIIDFSINGQEAGFMLLFLSATLYFLVRPGLRSWFYLGVAWAGLMWTRPDSCVYIAVTAAAFLVFAPQYTAGGNRTDLLRVYVKAAAVAILLYSPWLVWATLYYGTPVPHTVAAKSVFVRPGLLNSVQNLLVFPLTSLDAKTQLGGVFAPTDYFFGGWPASVIYYCKAVEWICAFTWLFPGVNRLTRVFSFSTMAGVFYVLRIAVPYSWYYPPITFLAIITLALLLQQLLDVSWLARRVAPRRAAIYRPALLSIFIAVHVFIFMASSYQLKLHQSLVEDSLRRPLGLWLRDNARPGDTVFLESLGYIGFYSQLKTYDYPGMSSPEMVAARHKLGPETRQKWNLLISYLKPEWLVLRPEEAYRVRMYDPVLLQDSYQLKIVFSSAQQIEAIRYIPGREYLNYDETFLVFRKKQEG